ncbi:amino acid adenylation domain-containing protein [Williamsia sp. SKLECPSW1]
MGEADAGGELSCPRAVDDVTPLLALTAAQRAMWFAELAHDARSVTVAHYLDVTDGDRVFDRELFRRGVETAARSLQSAHTRFAVVDEVPLQWIEPDGVFTVDEIDLRDADDPLAAAHEWMAADHTRPMDLLADPVAVSTFLRVADDRTLWYLRGHHIAFDGVGALTCLHEAVDRYNAAVRDDPYTAPTRASIADVVADDARYATSSRRETDRAYWAERVADLPEPATLARRTAPVGDAAARHRHVAAGSTLTPEAQARLTRAARDLGASVPAVLGAAFAAFLARMTASDEVVLSLPVTARTTALVKRSAGMVANMLPVRLPVEASTTVADLVRATTLELTGCLRHQRFRFEDIRALAGLTDTSAMSFGPIVNMVLFDRPLRLEGADVGYRILSSGVAEDLRLNVYQAGGDAPVEIDLHGNAARYRADEIETHLRRFLSFLDGVVTAPESAIADLDLLLPGEGARIAALSAGPAVALPAEPSSVLADFDRQVAARPDAVAIDHAAGTLTYAEVDRARRGLAGVLAAEGVGSGDRVVVALPRGIEQVCAIYATLTLGAAWVPVDPDDPADRRAAIAKRVRPAAIVDADFLTRHGGLAAWSAATPSVPTATSIPADLPAYVLFTSGSTGEPKGVEVGHAAVRRRLTWMQDDHALTADDAVLYKTPATFDVSVWELLWPLATGARMVIAAPDGHRDPQYLRRRMVAAGVTVAHFVPSMLDTYLDVVTERPAFGADLRLLVTSGEALDATSAARVRSADGPTLVNLYGPTEATVDVTRHVVGSEDVVPIGRPVPGTVTRVLDARLRPVPPGVAGELYLAGGQLAHGYVGAVGLTADRFLADPHGAPGARMYRTGDIVRWDDDGALEYLGRGDDQVKIRGRRVELGEIGSVVTAMPGVDAAVVVARHDLGPAPVLVAYLRGAADVDAVRAWCRTRLPAHMVPEAAVVLDAFPTTRSGKLDRRGLPAPTRPVPERHVAAATSAERVLVDLVADALGRGPEAPISVTDNMFRLGADSLVAARLVARARAAGLLLALTDVFDAHDLRELAARATVADDGGAASASTGPARPERPERIPLAPAQTRLWFTHRMAPDDATYNMSGALALAEPGDVDAWRAAVVDVLDRHEILRTVFPAVDGEPVQQILPTEDAVTRLEASSPLVVPAGPVGRSETIAALVESGFDLLQQVPVRAVLVTGDPAGDAAVVVVHHIAADGFSLRPLLADLVHAYGARRAGRAPAFTPLQQQYADVAVAQAESLGTSEAPSDRLVEGLAFWEEELRGAPQLLELPTDRRRPRVASGAGATVDLTLSPSISDGVRALAAASGTTPFSVFHTALDILLAQLGSTDDVSIGTAVAGRDDPALADLVGMFVTTVVLRTAVGPATTVTDLLAHNHHVRATAMAHADIPFERVVDALAPQRTPAHSPLFQVALTVGPDHLADLDAWSGSAGLLDARVPAAKYDLTWSVTDRPDAFGVEISYATDLFDAARIDGLGVMFRRVLAAMIDDPRRAVGTVDVLAAPTVAALTAPRAASAAPVVLADLLAAGAALADPTATAISGDITMTWSDLQATTARWARDLITRGIGPGDVVALTMPRSAHLVLAVAAVAATGAAFVTVDPRFPAARVATMIADSGARVVLATGDSSPSGVTVPVVLVDDADVELRCAAHAPHPVHADERIRPIHVDDLAYLLYTSGSTGTPKAAGVTHAGLATLVAEQHRLLHVTPASRVLHVASPGFDVAVFEILLGLCAGAELVVSPADAFAGTDLEAVVAEHGVTHAVLTPSVAATVDPAAVPSISTVMVAGEACPPELPSRWSATGRGLINLYGPTEATITSTATPPLREGDPITIGTPIDGVGALVLGPGLRPVPEDVVGELYLSGAALGRGYHGRPDLTALRFVASPFAPGERLYRTGDLASRTAGGALVYHGRNDFQVKIRGMRIEPGEVDAVLADDPSVTRSVTVGAAAPSGETVLVSYVTGSNPSPQGLIERARNRLPAHLVPRTVVVLDAMPTTRTHKIDRTALPPVEIGTADVDHVAPRTQMEAVVAEAVADVLGTVGGDRVGSVGVDQDFFALGGSSLSAARLAAHLERVLDRRVPAAVVFENPTPAALAAHLTTATTGTHRPLVRRPRPEVVGASDRQRGLWMLNRADPTSAAYVIALTLDLDGAVDHDALSAAIGDLVARHETLRTVYPLVGEGPVQVIVPAEQALGAIEIIRRDVAPDDASVRAAIGEVTGRGFDLVTEPGVRAAILRVDADRTVLVVAIHHMNADGASLAPLARDLTTAYAARVAGATPPFLSGRGTPVEVDYADWTRWHAERLAATDPAGVTEEQRQLAYWGERLYGAPDRSGFPTDRPRPDSPGVGEMVDVSIPAEVVTGLEEIARAHAATVFMVVHTALAVLLARLSGSTDVVVGTPHAGRDDRRLDDVVGMFVTTVPLRTRISPHEPFTDLLARVRTEDLADLARADVPFDRIVDHVLGRPSSTLHTPLFGVMVAFQDLGLAPVTIDGVRVTPRHPDTATAKVDLEVAIFPDDIDGVDRAGGLGGRVTYDTTLFDRSTVETLVQRWVRLLESVVADPSTPVGDLSLTTPAEEPRSTPDDIDEPGGLRSGRGALVGASAAAGLVSAAAAVLPDVVAVDHDGAAVTFLDLEASAVAMATALPDTDPGTALVVALTGLLPTLGVSDTDETDGVHLAVDAIARRAAGLLDALDGAIAGDAAAVAGMWADGAESA